MSSHNVVDQLVDKNGQTCTLHSVAHKTCQGHGPLIEPVEINRACFSTGVLRATGRNEHFYNT